MSASCLIVGCLVFGAVMATVETVGESRRGGSNPPPPVGKKPEPPANPPSATR